MLKKLWTGFQLKCPNCEQGDMMSSALTMHTTCPVCGVQFERKSGESAGASIIWVSVLPILAMILFFVLEFTLPALDLWTNASIALGFVLVVGVLFYRNVRGLWVAVSYLTGDVYADKTHS